MEELLLKYIKGDATTEETEKVMAWINGDAENKKEFLALRKLYDISIWQSGSKSDRSTNSTERHASITRSVWFSISKIAAIFILAFFCFYGYNAYWQSGKDLIADSMNRMQTLHVPAGQRAELTLADGTKVWLNAMSTLTFPNHFTDAKREVQIDGEGYFQVSHNANKPFIVKTDKYDVRVLGTEFDVLAYKDKPFFELSLLKGSVEVRSNTSSEKITMEPDRHVSLENGHLRESHISNYNSFLWRKGIIYFENRTVYDMMKQLELYYDIKIVVENKSLKNSRFTGKFRTRDGIVHLLKVLQLNNRFTFSINEDLNIITIH